MKSSKEKGAKYTQMNGAVPLGETEPLFPRLHINETEKAGPRAPPRNKMALFEQFTVPSHRFVQPSGTSTSSSNQKQQFVPNDNRHPYVPYCVPYSNVKPVPSSHSQPSHCMNSCVTSSGNTSVADEESQRASRSVKVGMSVGVSRLTTKDDGSSLMDLNPSDDNTQTKDLLRAEAKEMQCIPNTVSVESAERLAITNFKDSLQEALNIVEEVSTCPMVESSNCGDEEKVEFTTNMNAVDNAEVKQVALKSSADVIGEHNQSHLTSCEQSICAAAVTRPCKASSPEERLLHVDDLAEGGESNDLWVSRGSSLERGEQIPLPSGSALIDNAQTTSMIQQLSGLCHISKDAQKRDDDDGEKRDADANELSVDSLPKDKEESAGESQNNQINSNQASELSQHGNGLRGCSDSSSSSLLATQVIRPKDVIRAVGQQQFWKARKSLLRQQRIFSEQVFQLHKLIKVQQLLAEMPGTLLDEEMSFGGMDECAATPSHGDITVRELLCGEKSYKSGPGIAERNKTQASEIGVQIELAASKAVGKEGRGSKLYLPTFSPGGISAWGYPSLGLGQWLCPAAVQGRPSAYQPFAGTFAQGAPFSGIYRPAMLGPVSPFVPLGFPLNCPRNEPSEEISSNYDPAARPDHQAGPVMCHNIPSHIANDLIGAQYYMHSNNFYYNQRAHSNASEKDVPTGLGASINNQMPAKTVQSSGMHPWREASHTGRLNTNGLESFVHQSENSVPFVAPQSKCKSSVCVSLNPGFRETDSEHPEVMHPAQSLKRNGAPFLQTLCFENYEATKAGEEEREQTTVRWLKHEESNQVPLSTGHSEAAVVDSLSDQTGNALDLFPLVPSLSPHEQNGYKQREKHWQGRVIKAVPHPAVAASQSAAGILLSLQRERKR